jgi:hypothetical protein
MSENVVDLIMEKENWLKVSYYFPWIKKSIDRVIAQIDEKIQIILRNHKSKFIKIQTEV